MYFRKGGLREKIKDIEICSHCSFPKELCICDRYSDSELSQVRKWGRIIHVITREELEERNKIKKKKSYKWEKVEDYFKFKSI
ncbi:MAG: hypothetical protein ACFFAS_02345 [Promethearchaeota archaeon]